MRHGGNWVVVGGGGGGCGGSQHLLSQLHLCVVGRTGLAREGLGRGTEQEGIQGVLMNWSGDLVAV
jgi:hypothetical protein